jgi:hypothetical protein
LFKESETEEPNGVLIKIPVEVKDISIFKISYIRATLLWKDRPILKDPISYPELVFSYDDIKVFNVFSTYTKNDDSISSGVYLDGHGVPFLINNIFNKTTKERFSGWCGNFAYAIFIKADPYKMGISANREGFVNQAYASNKAENAYNKLNEYAANIFKPALLSDYLQLYKKYYWLTSLEDKKDFLEDKPYTIFMYSPDSSIQFSLLTGYFLRLVPKSIFIKQLRANISFNKPIDKENEIYLSRSKCLWVDTPSSVKNIKGMPYDLSKETKNAIAYGKTLDFNPMKTRYVFFQNALTDEYYKEVAQIIGANEYIEDLYQKNIDAFKAERKKERLASKEQRDKERKEKLEKKVQEKPILKVYPFKMQYKRLRSCGREKCYSDLHHLLSVNSLIFYGSTCSRECFNFLKAMPLNISVVFVPKKDIEVIKQMDNPKLKPIEYAYTVVKNDQTMLKIISEYSHIKHSRDFWRFFNKYEIESKKFDIKELKKESSAILKQLDTLGATYNYGEYTTLYKGQNVFEEFLETYPLLTYLTKLYGDVVADVNIYIKAIDTK